MSLPGKGMWPIANSRVTMKYEVPWRLFEEDVEASVPSLLGTGEEFKALV